jgi:hypothetical protein
LSIKGGAFTPEPSVAIMSQRGLENYIKRRIKFLNQQINQRREVELRKKNQQRYEHYIEDGGLGLEK